MTGTVRTLSGAKGAATVYIAGGTIDPDGRLEQAKESYVALDGAGNFSVDAVAALGATYPQYWLKVSSDGRIQANGVWHGTSARVPVTLPSSVSLVVAENAPRDQKIDVTVADVPVSTEVSLLRWDDQTGWRAIDGDVTDAAGKVELSGYKNGRYTLRIYSTPTNHPQYLGGSAYAPESPTAPGTFATNADATATFSFAAVRSGTVSGRASWAGVVPTDPTVTLLRWYGSAAHLGRSERPDRRLDHAVFRGPVRRRHVHPRSRDSARDLAADRRRPGLLRRTVLRSGAGRSTRVARVDGQLALPVRHPDDAMDKRHEPPT